MTDKKEIIFLSYAREDQKIAQQLFDDLTKAGLTVWYDKVSLLPGQRWKIEINKAINESSFFIANIID